jgi:hypothetical protein
VATLRDNIIRFKRFQRLKVTLRTDRSRLLVGLDLAQAKHMVHLRHGPHPGRDAALTIPNTTRNFAQLWARIQQTQRATVAERPLSLAQVTLWIRATRWQTGRAPPPRTAVAHHGYEPTTHN